MLSENDKKFVMGRYRILLEKYGYSPKSIGWPKGDPEFRYHILTSLAVLQKGDTLLDLGCGFGDLFSFLNKYSPGVKYMGVDFNNELIEVGKNVYPDADLRVGDIMIDDFGTFDWVVAYGIFNNRLPETSNEDSIKKTVQKMFQIAKKGVSVNFLTSYVDYTNPMAYHVSPEWAFSFAKTLTKRVCLRHDYMPYDFFLYLYKDETNDRNVFNEAKENWETLKKLHGI
jgi:ubiquinone/menaquinone biosynthesis C-methylase UbiE